MAAFIVDVLDFLLLDLKEQDPSKCYRVFSVILIDMSSCGMFERELQPSASIVGSHVLFSIPLSCLFSFFLYLSIFLSYIYGSGLSGG
jgi:hypothetical protein